jgi:hypothetical protein
MQNSRFIIKIIHLQLILPDGAFSDLNTSGAPYAQSHLRFNQQLSGNEDKPSSKQ